MVGINLLMNSVKTLITSLFSILDIFTDFLSSLDFYGYPASDNIKHMAIDVMNNSFINSTRHFLKYDREEEMHLKDVHVAWGTTSVLIMFLPGMSAIIMLLSDGANYLIQLKRSGRKCMIMLLLLLFPITLIVFQLFAVFTCRGRIFQGYIAIGVALEAFVESCFQMILQIYSIMYGYQTTLTQKASIAVSFIILSKGSIDLDIAMFEMKLSSTILHYLKTIVGNTATIGFRVISLAITIAFLRIWCLIPMFFLIVELMYVAYWFGDVDGISQNFVLTITNLGVTNSGVIVALEFLYDQEKREMDRYDANKIKRFLRVSCLISFLHHVIVLSVVYVLILASNGDLMEHWSWDHFILHPYYNWHRRGYPSRDRNCKEILIGFISTVGLGFFWCNIRLHLRSSVLKVSYRIKLINFRISQRISRGNSRT